MTQAQAAKEKLVEDFSAVIADSEELLKAMASAGGEKATALRSDLERKLKDARVQLDRIEEVAIARSRAAAKQADEYVHANPWQSMAIVASVAAIVGIVLGLILNRR